MRVQVQMASVERFSSEAKIVTMGQPSWTAQQLFVAFVPALFLFAVLAFGASIIPDGDPYWHIATGDWILSNGAIPKTDPFSHTFGGAAWTAHEWLSGVILAVTYNAAGLSGLHLLVGLAGMTTAYLLARELLKYLDAVPALIVLQFALSNIVLVPHARPQFLTFPIIVYWLGELIEARRQDRLPRWTLLPLMVVWANMHGGFILGLALLGPFALEAALAAGPRWRRVLLNWALFGLGALVAALVNPSGFEGLVFPLKLMSMTSLSYIAEWRSVSFDQLMPFEVTLLAILFFCLFRGVRVPLIRLALLLALLHQALAHRRFTIVFAIAAALLLAEPIAAALAPRRNKETVPQSGQPHAAPAGAALLFVVGLSILRLTNPVTISDNAVTPVSALASVPDTLLQQPVFNEYRLGGYLILRGLRPFIDGRADMYGDEFMRQYNELGRQKPGDVEQTFAKYGVTWAIVYPVLERERLFESLPGWRCHHKDEYASVYVRDSVAALGPESCPATDSEE